MEMDSEKRNLLEQFTGVTGVDEGRARFFLESAAWKIEIALANFYEDPDGDEEEGLNPPMDTASVPSDTRQRLGKINIVESDSDDEEQGQEFYVGGSDTSGQQVVGPPKTRNKNRNKIVENLFQSAREHGAEAVETDHTHQPPRTSAFRGTGHRLGDTEAPSDVVAAAAAAAGAPSQSHDVVLKLWQNGFTVNDGPLRDYREEESQEFLSSIKKGEVPNELIRMAKGKEVSVNMEDHRGQEYVKPKVAKAAFTGQGYMLGSPAPNVTTNPPPPSDPVIAPPSMEVNHNLPTTSIQIRLADGTRLVSKFNQSHTISDIRRFIQASRPEYASMPFVLQTTFPNKELTDDSQTIEDAKLLNAVIMQRPK